VAALDSPRERGSSLPAITANPRRVHLDSSWEVGLDTRSHTPGSGDSQKLQALSRELNERLQRLAEQNGSKGMLRLLCECGHCNETIDVAADVYEHACSTAGVLLIKQGHEQAKPVCSQNEHTSLVEGATA
jgi:hypothetical protein